MIEGSADGWCSQGFHQVGR